MAEKDKIYNAYHNMKSRCYLPTYPKYEMFGGRGIKVYSQWLGKDGFQNFYEWAMNNGYRDGLVLYQIDKKQSYFPCNCQWVEKGIQNNNLSKNNYYTYNGETKSVSDWARQYGIDRNVLNKRLRRGWDFEKAVSVKVRGYKEYEK